MDKTFFLLAVLGISLVQVQAHTEFVYAGFNHVLVFDTNNVTVTAYDYRRHLPSHSVCDPFAYPALLRGVEMRDWMLNASLAAHSQRDLVYTHMGYEVFLVENKDTGAYLTRRCRDFRPQLTALPCEALGTGQSDYLKDPYKTIFIGNDRVIILNTASGEFFVQVFDADVHTGGDPFRFSLGPILSDTFPFTDGLADSEFAYIQLKNHGGDLLLIQRPNGFVEGWRFNGLARDLSQWYFRFAFRRPVKANVTMATLGENQAIFYSSGYTYSVWNVAQNGTNDWAIEEVLNGNALVGHACVTDNVTECTHMEGCAWCPLSYTCHAYDHVKGFFCDTGACEAQATTTTLGGPDILPDCVKEVPVDANVVEIFDTVDEGYKLLPGNVRLDADYRKDIGDPANEEAAPINPLLDNELGEKPDAANWKYLNQIIDTNNRVADGNVYRPPSPGDAAPCMNGGYDPKKAADPLPLSEATSRMNVPPTEVVPPTFAQSPLGEVNAAENDACNRRVNVSRALNPDERFVPRPGDVGLTQTVDYNPASTATRYEEDLMNFDKTPFADIKGQMGVEAALDTDLTRSVERVEDMGFKPKEPVAANAVPSAPYIPMQPPLREYHETAADVMNEGLSLDHLNNPDCTENGGEDGFSTSTFLSAMKNSQLPTMPETLEAQLNLFKNENKNIVDNAMVVTPLQDPQLMLPLPPAPEQPPSLPPVDLNTAINGVSPDESADYLKRISHHANH